jgi:hypothetical protein
MQTNAILQQRGESRCKRQTVYHLPRQDKQLERPIPWACRGRAGEKHPSREVRGWGALYAYLHAGGLARLPINGRGFTRSRNSTPEPSAAAVLAYSLALATLLLTRRHSVDPTLNTSDLIWHQLKELGICIGSTSKHC